jgi:hypothetical protein
MVAANISFWPTILFLLPAILFGIRHRSDPKIRFLLAWAGATWIMFELAPTKLPHYVLPAYPALAILAALWLNAPVPQVQDGWDRSMRIASAVLFTLVGLAFAAFIDFAPMRYGDGPPAWLYAASALLALLVLAAAFLAVASRRSAALAVAGIAAVALYCAAGFGAVPHLGQLWVTETAAATVARHARAGDPPVISSGYEEASMTFRLGTRTHLVDGARAAAIASIQGGLAMIEDGERETFLEGLAADGGEARPVDRLSGFNYSRGRTVRITVYRVTPAYQVVSPPLE